MSDELDRRAALAMGWTWIQHTSETFDESDGHWTAQNGHMERYFFSPSTDRNDLSELLREVERRGMQKAFIERMSDHAPMLTAQQLRNFEDDWLEPFWYMTADPAIICEAVCEVLEAANERN